MDDSQIGKSFPPSIPFPSELVRLCEWVETNGYPVSGYFELRAHDDETIRLWFGSDKSVGDLAQFGAGPDGSLYCVWRQEDGRMPIVHLGSEGQNNFVLASTAVDFMRLLAIGYDEIGFADLDSHPQAEDDINPRFQSWVCKSFDITIPQTGNEIVRFAQQSHDDFQKWIDARVG